MDNKTKSILFQVAFKASVEAATNQGLYDDDTIRERTMTYYNILIDGHEELGIDGQTTSKPRRTKRSGPNTNDEGVEFELDGVMWRDFRQAKADNRVKPNFPDFKSEEGDSLWLNDKEGNPVPEAETLAKSADIVG